MIGKNFSNYTPRTVTTDGWQATKNAWKTLFPSLLLILCFLHVFIKVRDRAKKKFQEQEIFEVLSDKIRNCLKAPSRRTFS